ncbi:MAG TPA: nickel pincer cofactor biosynthesis protein LarC [Bacillota bacterium]|nr:nickel pincer cofactor biosynthesis protein LarC [Bacillota bacterium]
MRVLYYDCFSGISGDMNIGAMLDLGVPERHLNCELAKLKLESHYSLNITRQIKMGIAGVKFDVVLTDSPQEHEHIPHDGHEHGEEHEHIHNPRQADDHDDAHPHAHSHGEEQEHHEKQPHKHHDHRGLTDIAAIINNSELSPQIKQRSVAIFTALAEAEARVHGTSIDEVHFHEVGAVDAIVDIVGAAICLDYLKIDAVFARPPETGHGFVKCAHGIMPVPAPATAELLRGIKFTQRLQGEATTPTGAAILRSIVTDFVRPEELVISRIGYGLGTKNFTQPNVLRVYLGDINQHSLPANEETQYLLETNIDDMSPELLAVIEKRLLSLGALDVFRTPIFMKKGRLGVKLSVLYTPETEAEILHRLFTETTTIGVRRWAVDKLMLHREMVTVTTPYGDVRVKRAYHQGQCVNVKPEFDDIERLAVDNDLPVKELYIRVLSQLEE